MCYKKPGPRCSTHAREAYVKASQHFEQIKDYASLSEIADATEAYDKAKDDFLSTPAGFKAMEQMIEQANPTRKTQLVKELILRKKNRQNAISSISSSNTGYNAEDITTWTPVNIDESAATVMHEQDKLGMKVQMSNKKIDSYSEMIDPSYRYHVSNPYDVERYTKDIEKEKVEKEKLQEELRVLDAQAQTYEEEFDRRGGWTRAFIVTKGHVHKSRSCSSCYPDTQYGWVTEMSGKNQDDVIDAAGERACTVCYQDAPVDKLRQPTRLFTRDEQDVARAREERENKSREKKANLDAKAITAADGQPLLITRRGHVDKMPTLARAKSVYMDTLMSIRDYEKDKDERFYEPIDVPNAAKIKEAIIAKTGVSEKDFDADVEKKMKVKRKKIEKERVEGRARLLAMNPWMTEADLDS